MEDSRSKSTKKLDAALFAVRGDLDPILKDSENPFFNSNYAGLPTTIRSLDPVFRKHGVLVLQGSVRDSIYDDDSKVALHITTEMIHVESGEFRISTLTVPLKSQDPQQMGSAITYGRRYLWQLVAGAEVEDDDGNTATFGSSKPKAKPVSGKKSTTKPAASGKKKTTYKGTKKSNSEESPSSTDQPSKTTEATASSTPDKGTPSSKKSTVKFGKKKETPAADLPEPTPGPSKAFTYQPKD